MKKKIIMALVSSLLIVQIIPVSVFADSPDAEEVLYEISEYAESETDVIGKSVTLEGTRDLDVIEDTINDDKVVETENIQNTNVAEAEKQTFDAKITDDEDISISGDCVPRIEEIVLKIVLNKTKVKMCRGESVQLKATVFPESIKDKTVKWESDNDNIIVSEKGRVYALAEGEATITATASNGVKAICKVTAILEKPNIERIENTQKGIKVIIKDVKEAMSYTIERSTNGKDYKSIGSCAGNGGGVKDIGWEPLIPTYLDKDVINGTKYWYRAHYVTDWGQMSKPGKSMSIKCSKDNIVKPTKVKLSKKKIVATAGEQMQIEVKVIPSNAVSNYTLKSSNKKVVDIIDSGHMYFKKAGKATITATTWNGKKATCEVTVKKPIRVEGIKLNKTSAKIKVGKRIKLCAEVLPANAFDKSVFWDIDGDCAYMENVLDYNKGPLFPEDIYIVGDKPGTATVTAETYDGEKIATCKITVIADPVKHIKLDKSKVTLNKGEKITLKVKISPKNAYKKVKWSSSDKNIVTVSSKGKITAKSPGKATITVKTIDGKKKAICKVTVK